MQDCKARVKADAKEHAQAYLTIVQQIQGQGQIQGQKSQGQGQKSQGQGQATRIQVPDNSVSPLEKDTKESDQKTLFLVFAYNSCETITCLVFPTWGELDEDERSVCMHLHDKMRILQPDACIIGYWSEEDTSEEKIRDVLSTHQPHNELNLDGDVEIVQIQNDMLPSNVGDLCRKVMDEVLIDNQRIDSMMMVESILVVLST